MITRRRSESYYESIARTEGWEPFALSFIQHKGHVGREKRCYATTWRGLCLAAGLGIDALAPKVSPARYAKGKIAVHCPPDGSGMRTRAARLAAAMPGRYSRRESAYIMSSSAAVRLVSLYDDGRDAHLDNVRGRLDFVVDRA